MGAETKTDIPQRPRRCTSCGNWVWAGNPPTLLDEPHGIEALLLSLISTILDRAEDRLWELVEHELQGVLEDARRLRHQRDQAWMTLHQLEESLGKLDEPGLAFILAGGHGEDDSEQWNALISETEQ